MSKDLERAVARHYAVADLLDAIMAGVKAAGGDPERLRPEDLAPVDEFHIGGREATAHAVAAMDLDDRHHVLDVGCGLGGATRYLASRLGCRVTGIDLTPEFIAVAEALAARTGLADLIEYRTESALAMPFADGTFDAAITIHVAMNIRDRAGLYAEVARVLAPGAEFCVYDVMQGDGELLYPVPWAETAETSHLTTPDEMRALLADAGFEVRHVEDRAAFAIDYFRERLAAAADGPPPLGIHLLTGDNTPAKMGNMLRNIERGCIMPVVMLATRTAT